jgi:hypothetical protein
MNDAVGNKYYSENSIRAGHVACMGEKRKAYRNLVEESRGNRSLGTSWRRWKHIKIYVKERGWEGKDWIHMAQDREK